MSKMNPEIKAKWVAALRSGKYRQAQNHLHVGGGFCCYGVLCDISGLHEWEAKARFRGLVYGDRDGMPPDDVNAWAGFPRQTLGGFRHPQVVIGGKLRSLDDHNDGDRDRAPCTFAEIADAIEAQL